MDTITRGSGSKRVSEGQGSSGIYSTDPFGRFMHDNDRHDMENRLSGVKNIRSSLNEYGILQHMKPDKRYCDVRLQGVRPQNVMSLMSLITPLATHYYSNILPAQPTVYWGAFVDREVVLGCTKNMLYLSATSLSTFYGISRGHLHRLRQPASCNSLGRSARRSWRRLLD